MRREKIHQRNSFDTLRLFGSLIVLVGHGYIVTGMQAPMIGTIPRHSFGVCVFFSISGYLITQSWASDPDWGRYLKRRLIRILPALCVVSAVTALVIGAWVTAESPGQYFRHGWTWRYVVSNSALVTVWSLPGVFDGLPLRGQANGSLWTLPIEFGLYLFTAIAAIAVGRFGRIVTAVVLVGLSLAVAVRAPNDALFSYTFFGINVGWGLAVAPYYWLGALIRICRYESWGSSVRQTGLVISAFAFAIWAASPDLVPLWFAIPSISLLVIIIGESRWLHSALLDRVGDLSYGTYLWAFPIQQIVMQKVGGGAALNIAITLPVVLALAFASWRLIEKPALSLKPRRPAPPATTGHGPSGPAHPVRPERQGPSTGYSAAPRM